MQSIEKQQLIEDIKNCEKNIQAAKEVLEYIKKKLYQDEQLLIIYKNRLERLRNTK